MNDLHYIDGRWHPSDILANCPEGANLSDYLTSAGWETFLEVGSEDSYMYIQTWRREDGGAGYLLQVGDVSVLSPIMWVDTFPDLMDLVAKWTPVVQGAVLVQLLNDLTGHFIDPVNGVVEHLAPRVKYGVERMYEPMVGEYRQQERIRRQRAQERQAKRTGQPPTNPAT